jgi:hypothetical protein
MKGYNEANKEKHLFGGCKNDLVYNAYTFYMLNLRNTKPPERGFCPASQKRSPQAAHSSGKLAEQPEYGFADGKAR